MKNKNQMMKWKIKNGVHLKKTLASIKIERAPTVEAKRKAFEKQWNLGHPNFKQK